MNEVIRLLKNRMSLRKYSDEKITEEELDLILENTLRAPTAGNMMLYSIIVVKDEKKKEVLSKTCDNQLFIKNADTILIFLADLRRWYDFYKFSKVEEFCKEKEIEYKTPDEGDFLLSTQDAIISAQTSAIVCESLNIGSCYIGDIIENYETHKELFNLPKWTAPVCMLCIGKYENNKRIIKPRFKKEYIVFNEEYKRLDDKELKDMFKDKNISENNIYGAKNFGQFNYARKTGADFSKEMGRSVRSMIKEWNS
ncbi:MAG: nitroreductase family protein [Clostridium chrysemydis]|uniref:nitroreductase family protein n=1 Tax=Clostridium chrysemydis TaxID=2665504 RepID=UPI003F3927F4